GPPGRPRRWCRRRSRPARTRPPTSASARPRSGWAWLPPVTNGTRPHRSIGVETIMRNFLLLAAATAALAACDAGTSSPADLAGRDMTLLINGCPAWVDPLPAPDGGDRKSVV